MKRTNSKKNAMPKDEKFCFLGNVTLGRKKKKAVSIDIQFLQE